MEMNDMKDIHEKFPADVYDLIRSPEIRDFLRKEGNLDIYDKEQIILHSYISVPQKITMLKQLACTGNEEEAGLINETHDILAQYLEQIYHPVVRTIFMLENMEPYLKLYQKGIYIKEDSRLIDAYDTVDEMIKRDLELYPQDGQGTSLYGLASAVQVPQDEKLRTPFAFTLFWIDGEWQIKDIIVLDKDDLKTRGFSEDTILRFTHTDGSYPLPFEDGSRLKLQLPFMEEPFYGILSSWKDCYGQWYHNLYDENDPKRVRVISLTYAEIGITSRYSTLDWIERA